MACSSDGDDASPEPAPPSSDDGAVATADVCDPQNDAPLALSFDPPVVFVAPGHARPARVLVDPDVCAPMKLSFSVDGDPVVDAPPEAVLDHHAEQAVSIAGRRAGRAKVVVTARRDSDGATARAELAVEVRDPTVPKCQPGANATGTLSKSTPSVAGTGDLAAASVAAPAAAFARTDELALADTPVALACEADLGPGAIGPAVTFSGPPDAMRDPLRRELAFTIPIEPAAIPDAARLRHLRVFYKGPRAKKPRSVAVTSPRIVPAGAGWALAFESPWLGTYQAAFDADAGTKKTSRRLTHRAILGISMGAGGAASFGLRHHELFDTIAMLGGPLDWSWLLWFVDRHALGGFCAKADATCQKTPPNLRPIAEPFVHTMDYDHLWSEDGAGGGGVSRREYLSMLTDLALVRGNPNGQNASAALSFFAAGPKPGDPWVVGAPLPGEPDCSITVRPIPKSPDEAQQKEREARCEASRCDPSHRYVVESGYFDDEFNPDGAERVISFCDGVSPPGAKSPYGASWAPPGPGAGMPVSFALAVDLNKNGVRDEGEPIIRAGHEPFDDTGVDGVPDALEPGYDAATNPDPVQDDYDPQINPTGTEGDHRWQAGEPYRDVGLDGVADTKTRSAVGDVGEGDGAYTEAAGLAAFRAIDPSSLLRGLTKDARGGAPSDADLARLRIWTDGGVRDFLNFGRVADHFQGAYATRLGDAARGATFVSNFERLPGHEGAPLSKFDGAYTLWSDVPRVAGVRYGDVDATPQMIADGDGQHVGSGSQILARLGAAFHFVGQGWPDADRAQTETSASRPAQTTTGPLGLDCEVAGSCATDFTGPKSGRTAPVTIVLPPGYAHEANQGKRYPVLYVMHGYGQEQSDVTALAILTLISMNDGRRSYLHRLPKFIVVYVDGRCRAPNGRPECIAGTFFLDSPRDGGPRVETWTEELVDWMDRSFRTMPPSDVETSD